VPYTRDQIIAARVAMHAPRKLHKANRGMLKMSAADLREMATYKPKSLRAMARTKGK